VFNVQWQDQIGDKVTFQSFAIHATSAMLPPRRSSGLLTQVAGLISLLEKKRLLNFVYTKHITSFLTVGGALCDCHSAGRRYLGH
jgi:hypothetical protein